MAAKLGAGPRRLMIVGTPRSGTTLLQGLLATHPDVLTFPETHFFTGTSKRLGRNCGFVYRSPERLGTAFLRASGVPDDRAPGSFGPARRALCLLRPAELSRHFLDLMDTSAEVAGKPVWMEKTPAHLRYLDWIDREGNTRPVTFIHMIREHDGTVLSIEKASGTWVRPMDRRAASRLWARDVARHLSWVGRPRHHFVGYERLAADPEGVVAALFARLGMAFDPAWLERRVEASRAIVRDDEPWKRRNLSPGVGAGVARVSGPLPRISRRTRRRFDRLGEALL